MLRQGIKLFVPALGACAAAVAALVVYVSVANARIEPPKPDPAATLVFREGKEHPVSPAMAKAVDQLGGVAAPAFGAVDTDAQYHTLKSLTSGKPLVLFFVELQCPCCKGAKPFVDRIQETYGDVCNVVGVINADHDTAKAWSNAVLPKFRVLCDPDMEIIHSFKAQRGVYTTLVSPSGKVVKAYPGYSKDMLADIGRRIEGLAHTPPRKMAVADAPKDLTSGCLFPGVKVPVEDL